MGLMRTLLPVTAVVALLAAGSPEPSAGLIAVKYDGLKREVLKHRGKVLLVDFWAGY